MTAQKDPHFLASLIAIIESKRPNQFRWIVLGDGPLLADFVAATSRFTNVYTPGWVSQDIVQSSLAESHLFLSTSRWEADPFSVKEALGYRCHILLRSLPIHNIYHQSYDNIVVFEDLQAASEKLDYLMALELPDRPRQVAQPLSSVTIAEHITKLSSPHA